MRRIGVSLDRRLAAVVHRPRRSLPDGAFAPPLSGLRDRVEERIAADVERMVDRFQVDRLLYDIEVEAMAAWLRRLVAFDAYCARRAQRGGGAGADSVR